MFPSAEAVSPDYSAEAGLRTIKTVKLRAVIKETRCKIRTMLLQTSA